MVIWLIGMSASGKTTIGKKVFDKLLLSDEKWVFIDGDTFRNILGEDLGHTIEDRRKNAYRISRFCQFLHSQGINVLACVLSIFHENQKYNRENISEYKEVYIDVEFENLIARDNKQLYKKALKGEIKNVVGVDIDFLPPYAPDIVIDNNIANPNYEDMTNKILNQLGIKLNNKYSYTKSNLLKNPHKYQYSQYEGTQFFEKYKKDREETLQLFDYRISKLCSGNINIVRVTYGDYKKNNNLVLKDYLLFLLESDTNELEKQQDNIELLIKRFEVGKKLYLTYDLTELRKSSMDYAELSNYPLFSLILQKYYNYTKSQQKLVYLNAILKVNDIISSIKKDFILINEINFAKQAFIGELDILRKWI